MEEQLATKRKLTWLECYNWCVLTRRSLPTDFTQEAFICVVARMDSPEPPNGGGDTASTKNSGDAEAVKPGVPPLPTEAQIENSIIENWDAIPLFQDYEVEEGTSDYGGQYPICSRSWSIDILARHKTKKEWLVIEIKRDKGGSAAVGQMLRYIAAVKKEVAEPGDDVRGLIIVGADGAEERDLRYALADLPNIGLAVHALSVEKLDVRSGGER